MESILIEHFKKIELTKGQSKIAQYMIDHEYELCRMSLMDISKAVGVSDASVLRFVRCIGFAGFSDFKEKLYEKLKEQAELSSAGEKSRLRDRLHPSNNGPDVYSLMDTASAFAQTVEASLTQNSEQSYAEVAAAISAARTVYIFGARGTLAVAEQFARCLRFISCRAVYLNNAHDMHAALSGAAPEDLLVFFCTSRFYAVDEHVCRAAEAAGVPLCLITDSVLSPLSKFASYALLAGTSENTFFSSMLGVLAVAEYLIIRLSQGNEQYIKEHLDRFDLCTEEERLR